MMKIEYLEERVSEYKNSIKLVVEKRIYWNEKLKKLIIKVLEEAENTYNIGWKVQVLNWIHTNEAINITFHSFPPELIETTNKIPTFQFLQGGSLVFSQVHNGDVDVFVLFPILENMIPVDDDFVDLGTFQPKEITEKLVVEKLDDFLKEMIKWEVPIIKSKLGFTQPKPLQNIPGS